jgi:RNA polymerase sigma-70 factor (ECF subfamily)
LIIVAAMGDERLIFLYRTYGAVTFRRCRHILADDADAEDALHETFVRILRHVDKLPPPDEVLRWIYRIATNYCFNKLRDRKLTEPIDHLVNVLHGSGETELANRDLLRKLLMAAPRKLGEVAWMYYVDEMEQEAIAATLEISRRTVINRLNDFRAFVTRYDGRTA